MFTLSSVIDLTLQPGIKETKAAFQARNEDRDGEWRCPGCQTVRTMPPGPYKLVHTASRKEKKNR